LVRSAEPINTPPFSGDGRQIARPDYDLKGLSTE
jgi:hypothetical protein